MTRATTRLGGTASDIVVGKVGHGLMFMTWTPSPVPDEQCFAAIKGGIDALPPGVKMFLNGGEFYGHNLSTTNLEMIARFFEKYPEYVDRDVPVDQRSTQARWPTWPDGSQVDVDLVIVGCTDTCSFTRPENLARSINLINEKLRGTKRLDLFECARVDPDVPVEVSIAALAKLRSEGKLDHIGMSECSAETLRRGHKIHPISVVEIEVSPFSYEPQARDVIATAKELGIAVATYSPLGRGVLTGQIKKADDLPADDWRRFFPRFQEDNLKHNAVLVDAFTEIAQKKNVTTAQLCIGWVSSLGPHVIPIPGSSRVERTLENSAGGDVAFTETELQEVNELIESLKSKEPGTLPMRRVFGREHIRVCS
ncbi:NADP-dependent oxidoreductase domain-containing protein [Chiua virens]|nr:NADP-dependent oxidoreductase domain-containing protein [Chiua virens]